MSIDALAPSVNRASADMISKLYGKQYVGLFDIEFGLLLNKTQEMIRNVSLDQSYQSITQTFQRQAQFNDGRYTDQICLLHEFVLHHYFLTTHYQIAHDSIGYHFRSQKIRYLFLDIL